MVAKRKILPADIQPNDTPPTRGMRYNVFKADQLWKSEETKITNRI